MDWGWRNERRKEGNKPAWQLLRSVIAITNSRPEVYLSYEVRSVISIPAITVAQLPKPLSTLKHATIFGIRDKRGAKGGGWWVVGGWWLVTGWLVVGGGWWYLGVAVAVNFNVVGESSSVLVFI